LNLQKLAPRSAGRTCMAWHLTCDFHITTRNLLIRDEKFSSWINKKSSLYSICDGFRYRHGLSVIDELPWRFTENRHRLKESVTILNRHNRARSLASLAQGHFQWRKIIVTDALPHHHRCLRGRWHGWWRGIPAHLIIAQHQRLLFLACFQPIYNMFQPICNLFSTETRERDGSREQLIDWVIEAFSAAVSSLSPWGKVMHVRLIHNWAKHVWLVFIFP